MPSRQTVYCRSRPGFKVRRLCLPHRYLRHDRAKPVPAILRLPTELRLVIWELVVNPGLPNTFNAKKKKKKKKLFSYDPQAPPRIPSPPPHPPPLLSPPRTATNFDVQLFVNQQFGMYPELPGGYSLQNPDSFDPESLLHPLSSPAPYELLDTQELSGLRLPPVIMVCKQMCSEILPILLDSKRWRFDVPAQFDMSEHLPYLKQGPGITVDQRECPTLTEAEFETSRAFVTTKLQRLRKAIDDSDMSRGATAFPFDVRTYEPKRSTPRYPNPFDRHTPEVHHFSDFPLANRLPWATWSWIRLAEPDIELKHLRLSIHLDRHVSTIGPHELTVNISVIGQPGKKSNTSKHASTSSDSARIEPFRKARAHVRWDDTYLYQRLKPFTLEIQPLLDETVRLISSRKGFRGFTLLDVEVLASVFQFEAWECEEPVCWHCNRWPAGAPGPALYPFDDPFANLDFTVMPPPPPPPPPVLIHDSEGDVADVDDPDLGGDGDGDARSVRSWGIEDLPGDGRRARSRLRSDRPGRSESESDARERSEVRVRTSSTRSSESSYTTVWIRDMEQLQLQLGDLEQYP